MKKKIIIICLIIIFLIPIFFFCYKKYQDYQEEMRIKNATVIVDLKGNLIVTYDAKLKISDLIQNINGEITDDKYIDTSEIGKKKVDFKYINEEGIKIPYTINYEVVDNIPPIIWLTDTYSVKVGTKGSLEQMIMSGDEYDDNPKREIIGDYDLNTIGNYKLKYRIVDKSGNETIKDFTLKVHNNPSNYKVDKKKYSDIVKKYKDYNTLLGLDVSKWQGNIDYDRVVASGVDFVMIKLGGTNGIGGEYYVDPKFKENIEGFLERGVEVGVYFYSYADSVEAAKREAGFVINELKNYNISFPIAFDWENWGSFNKFNMSFKTLSNVADSFIKEIEDNGYIGVIYSSKNYLEKIWDIKDNPVWLAHYTDKTDYKGEYIMWQMTSGGVIPGITENTVDINILYKDVYFK